MSPPGRHRPKADGLRQATDSPQGLSLSSLRPKGEYRSATYEGTPVNTTAWPEIAPSERLIVVVGPSGAGKDSVLRAWAALRDPNDSRVHQAQRVISRPAEGSRDDSEQHEPVSEDDFRMLQELGAFATAWQAHGLRYGVRHRAFAPLAAGDWVVLNSSRAHLPVLRQQGPRLSVVEVTAPADTLARRLVQRGREDAATLSARLQRQVPPAQANLTLVDDSSIDEVVQGLHRWWMARRHVP